MFISEQCINIYTTAFDYLFNGSFADAEYANYLEQESDTNDSIHVYCCC